MAANEMTQRDAIVTGLAYFTSKVVEETLLVTNKIITEEFKVTCSISEEFTKLQTKFILCYEHMDTTSNPTELSRRSNAKVRKP